MPPTNCLGTAPRAKTTEWVDVWLEVQVDGRANLHYWYNEPEKAAIVLERARPVVEALGLPIKQGRLLRTICLRTSP